jgi:hypothetical protein
VELSHAQALDLAEATAIARLSGGSIPYGVSGTPFTLHAAGASGKTYRLENRDATILAGADQHGFCVVVEVRAIYFITHSLEEAVDLAFLLARALTDNEPDGARLRRFDLCVDVMCVDLAQEDTPHFVSRSRHGAQFHARKAYTKRTRNGTEFTGFVISPGNDISARLYNKTEELQTQHAENDEKRQLEEQVFRDAGWDRSSPVWRLELQLRGKALDRFEIRRPEVALAKRDSLWTYAFGSPTSDGPGAWCRLVVPSTKLRRERWPVDPRWRTFQGADFGAPRKEPAARNSGNRGGARIEHVLGSLRSCLAAHGRLPRLDTDADPKDALVADLEAMLHFASSAPDMVYRYAARREGARARFASVDDGTVVPEGRGTRATDYDSLFNCDLGDQQEVRSR